MNETELWTELLRLAPLAMVYLASVTVKRMADIVRAAVAWLKKRLQNSMGDVPHIYTHVMSGAFSLAITGAAMYLGELANDEAMNALPQPWSFLAFAVFVFLRAGGYVDLKRNLNAPAIFWPSTLTSNDPNLPPRSG